MKKVFAILIILCALFVSGFSRKQAVIVLNSQPITKETVNRPVQDFQKNQRINYALIVPKGFKDSVIRIQIIKKNEKVANWGYKIYYTDDICVDTSKKFHIDYFTIPEKGYYIFRAFEVRNLDEALAIADFWVK